MIQMCGEVVWALAVVGKHVRHSVQTDMDVLARDALESLLQMAEAAGRD